MSHIVVSTTDHIESNPITKYFNPLNASAALSTKTHESVIDVISNSLSGNQNFYEKNLRQLYEYVTELLKIKALNTGANGIVGLRYNFSIDEEKEPNFQKLILTAYGTPVQLTHGEVQNKSNAISGWYVEARVAARKLLKETAGNILDNDASIEIIANSGDPAMLSKVLEILRYCSNPEIRNIRGENAVSNKMNLLGAYFANVKWDAVKEEILAEFYKTDDEHYLDILTSAMTYYNKVDQQVCLAMLRSESITAAKSALTMLEKGLYNYNDADIVLLNELKNAVATEFSIQAVLTTKKKLLSSSEVEVWQCTCGKTNDITQEYCQGCKNDMYGFAINETKPAYIVELLEERITIINELLRER